MDPVEHVSFAAGAGGVIFPAERGDQVRWLGFESATGFWTPREEDVAVLERSLQQELERGSEQPEVLVPWAAGRPEYQEWLRGEIDQVLARLGEYKRQYVGILDADGRRQILLRGFPGPGFGATFDFTDWQGNLVVVDDGGCWYWVTVYDVSLKKLVYFDSNGYA